MTLERRTPSDKHIVETFQKHLDLISQYTQGRTEGAQHGENPEYASYMKVTLEVLKDATLVDLTAMWTAVFPAVVATVRELAPS